MDNARIPSLLFPLFFFLKYDLKISPPPSLLSLNAAKVIYSEAGIWMVAFKAMAPRTSVKPAGMLPEPSAHYPVVTSLMVIQFLKL